MLTQVLAGAMPRVFAATRRGLEGRVRVKGFVVFAVGFFAAHPVPCGHYTWVQP